MITILLFLLLAPLFVIGGAIAIGGALLLFLAVALIGLLALVTLAILAPISWIMSKLEPEERRLRRERMAVLMRHWPPMRSEMAGYREPREREYEQYPYIRPRYM